MPLTRHCKICKKLASWHDASKSVYLCSKHAEAWIKYAKKKLDKLSDTAWYNKWDKTMQKFIETEKKMMHNFLNKECDKKMIKARNQKGFTLVEVFVVIIILGSFALAAIYTVWNTHQLVITVEEQCQVNTKVIHVNDPPVLKSLNYYE